MQNDEEDDFFEEEEEPEVDELEPTPRPPPPPKPKRKRSSVNKDDSKKNLNKTRKKSTTTTTSTSTSTSIARVPSRPLPAPLPKVAQWNPNIPLQPFSAIPPAVLPPPKQKDKFRFTKSPKRGPQAANSSANYSAEAPVAAAIATASSAGDADEKEQKGKGKGKAKASSPSPARATAEPVFYFPDLDEEGEPVIVPQKSSLPPARAREISPELLPPTSSPSIPLAGAAPPSSSPPVPLAIQHNSSVSRHRAPPAKTNALTDDDVQKELQNCQEMLLEDGLEFGLELELDEDNLDELEVEDLDQVDEMREGSDMDEDEGPLAIQEEDLDIAVPESDQLRSPTPPASQPRPGPSLPIPISSHATSSNDEHKLDDSASTASSRTLPQGDFFPHHHNHQQYRSRSRSPSKSPRRRQSFLPPSSNFARPSSPARPTPTHALVPLTAPGFTSTLNDWLTSKEQEVSILTGRVESLEDTLKDRDESIGNYSMRLREAREDNERLVTSLGGVVKRAKRAERTVTLLGEIRRGLLDQNQELRDELQDLKKRFGVTEEEGQMEA